MVFVGWIFSTDLTVLAFLNEALPNRWPRFSALRSNSLASNDFERPSSTSSLCSQSRRRASPCSSDPRMISLHRVLERHHYGHLPPLAEEDMQFYNNNYLSI